MPSMLLLAVLAALVLCEPAQAAPWVWPVPERSIAARFHFDRSRPFQPGAHRGATIASTPGTAVRAVCVGRVAFAGTLPAMGKGVTIRCGRLAATEIGLAALAVRRGERVLRGDRLGLLAAGGLLRLGARVVAQPRGYRDPLALLGERPDPLDLPLGAAPRGPRLRRVPAPAGVPALGVPRLSISPLMIAATWLGLGLFAGAIGAGIAVRNVRRSRRADLAARAGLPGPVH